MNQSNTSLKLLLHQVEKQRRWKFSQLWKITDIHRNWENFWNFHGRMYSEYNFKCSKRNSIWAFLNQDTIDFPRQLKVSCRTKFSATLDSTFPLKLMILVQIQLTIPRFKLSFQEIYKQAITTFFKILKSNINIHHKSTRMNLKSSA